MRGVSINVVAHISDNFSTLIRSDIYEHYLLNLMNQSKKIFPNNYEWNKQQSHGECDFFDTLTKQKYDAKLPLNKSQGKLIGSRNHDYCAWFKQMIDEEAEFENCIEGTQGLRNVDQLSLYKIMEQRLSSISADEHAIFFFPYPIVFDVEGAVHLQFASDLLSAIFSELRRNGLVEERMIYVIYPSADCKVVLRCLNTRQREYLATTELDDYIVYELS